jgi:soluble lytic murein transglycosylase-like protein
MRYAVIILSLLAASLTLQAKTTGRLSSQAVLTIIKKQKTTIDPLLILAIARVESNLNPKAIGYSHKERGLFQLHPKYFPTATFEPEQNTMIAVKYLNSLKNQCSKKYGSYWFVCYNTGMSAKKVDVNKNKYIQKVVKAYYELRQQQQEGRGAAR